MEGLDLPGLVGQTSLGAPPARGALNVPEKVISAPLELVVEERDVLGGGLVEILIADWFSLNFPESVEVQLAGEGAELVVVEVLGDDLGRELVLFYLFILGFRIDRGEGWADGCGSDVSITK